MKDEVYLKGEINSNPPLDLGYGVPDWLCESGHKGKGGHNVKDKTMHSLRTSAQTHVMRNRTCRELYKVCVISGRKAGASTRDLASIFQLSTRTVYKIIKPCMDLRVEPAFQGRDVRKKNGGWSRWLGKGIKWTQGRIDVKGKLYRIAGLLRQWISFLLHTGYDNIEDILQSIDRGERPP